MSEYDAIIIGAGQAGSPLAHQLADRDWNVALIERNYLGGSCINYGCTPTKVMLASARAVYQAKHGSELGVRVGDVEIDLAKVVQRKDQLVQEWRQGQQEHADKRPSLHLFRETATFVGPDSIALADEIISSDNIFINTGTQPLIPPIPGLDQVDYLTNREILDLTELPEHLIVIGAGYIGLEFGQMFRRFGSSVTIIEMEGQITPQEDPDVADALKEILEQEGIEFHLDSKTTEVHQDEPGSIILEIQNERTGDSHQVQGSRVLLAAGRLPNSEALDLEAAGIDHDNGWIKVDPYLQTNVDGVFALGDIHGGPAFTHLSYNDYQIAFHNLFNDDKKTIKGRLVPYAMFTDPELGRVGMTELEARQAGHEIKTGTIPMNWVARAIERGDTRGLMKIVVDTNNDQILGAAIIGANGGELVQTLMALMMAEAPWTLFKEAVFIHPTMTEGFFTLMENVN